MRIPFFIKVRDNIKYLLKTFRESNFTITVKNDYRELKDFYLEEHQRERLNNLGFIKRTFLIVWWLLKSLFRRLTPVRQILLVIGMVFLFSVSVTGGGDVQVNNNSVVGATVLLFILLLELKDKLLAKSELSEGRAVQSALMPQEIPEVPGWDIWLYSMPANDVGGDLVDYIKITGERFAFILADISGKGLGAALLMAKLQSIFRALAPDYTSLSKFVGKLNSVFYRDSLKKSFASLIYLELIAESSQIRLVNAGHLPPFIITEHSYKELPKGQRALGLSEDVTYKEHVLDTKKDDVLFIYSDGLTEAINNEKEFFESRLNEILPTLRHLGAEEGGNWIVDAVKKYMGTAPVHDDLSLLILKKK